MFLGLDIGSSSSKAVILHEDGRILAARVVNLGTGTRGTREVLDLVFSDCGITRSDLLFCVVTGYGRMTYTAADAQITEISCHAKGVRFLDPKACSVIDIGGQDSKVIRLEPDGSVGNFVMNDKCAAGTGRFLEVMARVLDCPISALSDLAASGTEPLPISNMCTVFAESEVISHLAAGASCANVAAGAIASIASRVAGMAGRVGLSPTLMMTGGGAYNAALVQALSKSVGLPIAVSDNPQIVGALGAAVFARERYSGKNG